MPALIDEQSRLNPDFPPLAFRMNFYRAKSALKVSALNLKSCNYQKLQTYNFSISLHSIKKLMRGEAIQTQNLFLPIAHRRQIFTHAKFFVYEVSFSSCSGTLSFISVGIPLCSAYSVTELTALSGRSGFPDMENSHGL